MLTQRSLLHSRPRWFNSRHSSMSGGGVTGVDFARGPELHSPSFWSRQDTQGPAPPPASGPAPARLTHAARSGGVKLEATRTLAHGAARPQHAAAAHAATLVRILLRAVLLCASRQNTGVNAAPSEGLDSRLVPSPHSPRGGFPSSRGLASQKELLSLCDVGH